MSKKSVRGKSECSQRPSQSDPDRAPEPDPDEYTLKADKYVISIPCSLLVDFMAESPEEALQMGLEFMERYMDLPFNFLLPETDRSVEVELLNSRPEIYGVVDPWEEWTSPSMIEIPPGRSTPAKQRRTGEKSEVRNLTAKERDVVMKAFVLWKFQERVTELRTQISRGESESLAELQRAKDSAMVLRVFSGQDISEMGLDRPLAPDGYRHVWPGEGNPVE